MMQRVLEFMMRIFQNNLVRLKTGFAVMAIALTTGNVASAQSNAGAGSDTDYLSALDTMVLDMDLDGLAGQTFEAATVAAPQLSVIAAERIAQIVDCTAVMAQAQKSGAVLEIIGADASLPAARLAARSECMMPETGVVMSYLMPNS